MTLKAFSYRFYPTPEQESLLRRTIGCVRLVYNKLTTRLVRENLSHRCG
ncbi:MAG: helix-turn-helix domain-containing protein, partial [Microcoleus sp.]